LEAWLYYIHPAPQDNCLQRTYSIEPCTTLYNNKKIQRKLLFFSKLVVSIYVAMDFMFIVWGQERNMAFNI